MRIEKAIDPFLDWIGPALGQWAIAIVVLVVLALLISLLYTAIRCLLTRSGAPFGTLGRSILQYFGGLIFMSPMRIGAIAYLSIKEAIRKKIFIGFGVFVLILMMVGWYLDPSSSDPAKLYLNVVITMSNYVILLLMLVISAFSLPGDIKSRTLYTVSTKPVHASEIVLGRMVGFTALGTAMLAIMCVLSYVFVNFGLSHQHALTPEHLSEVVVDDETVLRGETGIFQGHKHPITVYPDGEVIVEEVNKHSHAVDIRETDDGYVVYTVEPNRNALVARVPVYGRISFRDRAGRDTAKGINVGDIWSYRSFIEGGSQAAAIWTFDNFTPARFPEATFPEGIPIDMSIGVFRSRKGDIERGILGSLLVRNPDTGLTAQIDYFQSEEFSLKTVLMPYSFPRDKGKILKREKAGVGGVTTTTPMTVDESLLEGDEDISLFDDLVTDDGRVEIWLQCVDDAQYFGAAQPDLYIHAANASVPFNFIKGFFGIWQQMVLVIAFAVMFSTYASAPVAMIATLGAVFVGGLCHEFLAQLSQGETLGGGPVESAWRLFAQMNMMSELPAVLSADIVKMADTVLQYPLRVAAMAIPPLADMNYADPVARGFDIPFNWVLVHFVRTIGYVIPVFLAAYLFLFNREVAK